MNSFNLVYYTHVRIYVCTNVGGNGTMNTTPTSGSSSNMNTIPTSGSSSNMNTTPTSGSSSNMNQEKSDDETGDNVLCINFVCWNAK